MQYYFDANATTPLCEAAREAWLLASEKHWHNPSSLYPEAGEARQFLEDLREELAGMFACEAARVVFTSGATEANNAVLRYAAGLKGEIAISAIEHPCVADAPVKRTEFAVTKEGVFDPVELENHSPAFFSLMAANNETGVLQPWREVAEFCHESGIIFHCDAAQWIGKLPPADFHKCDFVTASAHKFGGLPGTGFLIIPSNSNFQSQIGGPQERGHRGGTENLPSIAAMVAALKNASLKNCGQHRDQFEADLGDCLPGVRFLGDKSPRLGNTSMFVLPEHKNLRWLTRLGRRGIAVSTGSACSAGKGDPSRVMQAMGCSFEEMGRVLRVSALPAASSDDWEALLDGLLEVRDELGSRTSSGAKGIPKISLENL